MPDDSNNYFLPCEEVTKDIFLKSRTELADMFMRILMRIDSLYDKQEGQFRLDNGIVFDFETRTIRREA